MSTFLLLVGLSLFLTGGGMYLLHASRNDPRWVPGSLFFPIVVPLYYRRHWDELRVAGLTQAAGLAMTLSGLFIHLFQNVRPEGILAADGGAAFSSLLDGQSSSFVDSERALKRVATAKAGAQLRGQVAAQQFRIDRAEFIDGVLRLSKGSGFFPDAEIAVVLDEQGPAQGQVLKRAVAPGSASAPEVFLSWRDEQGNPVSQSFHRGYRLELSLAPLRKGQLQGTMQIVLPDRDESYAAGDFVAVTSHLRFKGDQIDPTYDHPDTLYFLGDEFLRTQYPQATITDSQYSDTVFDPLGKRGEAHVAVALEDGRVGRQVLEFGKNELGWSVLIPESLRATEAAGYKPVYQVLPPQQLAQKAAPRERQATPPRTAMERVLPFDQLGSLAGRSASVEYTDGRRESGVLRGMRKDRLVLETNKGGGSVEYMLARGEVSTLRFTDGDVVHVEGAAGATGTASSVATAASTATAASASAAPLVVAGTDVSPLMNRNVRLVSSDGKTTVGVLRGVQKDRLVVETMVKGGVVNYTVPVSQVTSVVTAGR